MNPLNRIAQLASRENGHNPSDGPPPGWPFNLPSRAALNQLEQALTEDRPRPDWYGSEVVVLNDEGRYVWSWSIDTPLGRRALGSNLYEIQDSTNGDRGLMYAHNQQQQQRAFSRGRAYPLSRQSAPALPQPRSEEVGAQAAQATQSDSRAPLAQQAPASHYRGPPAGRGRILTLNPTTPIVFSLPREQATIDPRNGALELYYTADLPIPILPHIPGGVMPMSSVDQPENNNRAADLYRAQSATGAHVRTNTHQAPEGPPQANPVQLQVAYQELPEPEADMDQDMDQAMDEEMDEYPEDNVDEDMDYEDY